MLIVKPNAMMVLKIRVDAGTSPPPISPQKKRKTAAGSTLLHQQPPEETKTSDESSAGRLQEKAKVRTWAPPVAGRCCTSASRVFSATGQRAETGNNRVVLENSSFALLFQPASETLLSIERIYKDKTIHLWASAVCCCETPLKHDWIGHKIINTVTAELESSETEAGQEVRTGRLLAAPQLPHY